MFKLIPVIFIFFCQMAMAQGAESECGSLVNSYGPYDYRTSKGPILDMVEPHHFAPQVEMLIKGKSGYLGGDIDYTLRAFPNHHRALMSVMRYGEITKSAKPPNMQYSVNCYFERAVRFRPDDAIARMMYSMYLAKNNHLSEAIQQLDIAANGAEGKENPFTHYNLGLNYFDVKEYDKSAIQAQKAYALGFPQTALKEKLTSVGKWTPIDADRPDNSTPSPSVLN